MARKNSKKSVTRNLERASTFIEPKSTNFEITNAENGGFGITTRKEISTGHERRFFVAKSEAEKNRIISKITKENK